MLSRADRILSELLLSHGAVVREDLERAARSHEAAARGTSLVDILVEGGALGAGEGRRFEEEARSIERSLTPAPLSAGRLGQYRILREIGRGGMGIVYEANHEVLQRRVALKILPAGAALDERLTIRFLREARAAARLEHPGIVRVLDSGIVDGVLYFTMDLVEGSVLSDLIAAGPAAPARAASLARDIALALAHAHAAGFIHRDVKPENVLIGADGHPRITDFGLVLESTAMPVTMSQAILGTPAYMAPEQAAGEAVDERADLYSLGAVLYAMLAGAPPFSGDVPALVLGRLMNGQPDSLAAVRPGLPRGIVAICERALEREPSARYSSALELAGDLDRFIRGERPEALQAPRAAGDQGAVPAQRDPGRPFPRAVLLAATGAAATAVIAGTWLWVLRGGPPDGGSGWRSEAIAGDSAPTMEGAFHPLSLIEGPKGAISISPDGTTLLFASSRDGDLDIYAQEIGSDDAVNLTADSEWDDFHPAFSPDGATIAFASVGTPRGLLVIPSTGGPARHIGEGWSPAWSPDGMWIAVAHAGTKMSRGSTGLFGKLSIVPAAGGPRRLLTSRAAVDPSWSPMGRRVAFVAARGMGTEIWTVRSDGSDAHPLLEDAGNAWSPRWSPDGRFLYFGSDRDGSLAIWRTPVDLEAGRAYGAPQRITRASFAAPVDLVPTPDGEALIVLSQSERSTIHRLSLDPVAGAARGTPSWVVRDLQHAVDLDVGPDGESLVLSLRVMGTSHEDLVSIRADGSERRPLTEDPWRDRWPRWSPDGSRIAFASDRGERMEIWTIRADGGDLHRVCAAPDGDASSPVWSPDGDRIAFASAAGGAYVVAVRDGEAEGPPEPLPDIPEEGPESRFVPSSWSAERDEIAGTRDGIVICSMPAGPCRRVTRTGENPIWVAGGKSLLYRQGAEIRTLDPSTGASRPLYSAIPNEISAGPAAASGRDALYVSLHSSIETAWEVTLRSSSEEDQGVR